MIVTVRHWGTGPLSWGRATAVPAKSETLDWEALATGHLQCPSQELDTGRHWASSASSDKILDTGVPVVSVTLQVPVWHCLQRG